MNQPTKTEAEAAVRTLLRYILPADEDLDTDGRRDTPERVVKAWATWGGGYAVDPAELVSKQFGDAGTYDGVIHIEGIPFHSMCEHHLAPIVGTADVAYMVGGAGKVIGLSKLPRLVDCFARRLQVQERIVSQISAALLEHIKPRPLGVAVRLRAEHMCMSSRGICKPGIVTTTQQITGVFRDNERQHRELMTLWGNR